MPSSSTIVRATVVMLVAGAAGFDGSAAAWIGPQGTPASTPAPVSLTASDGTGLQIVSYQARAVVEDMLAFTELHLVFRNPQARVLEGTFAITLPPGAAVSRFAMLQAKGWQEGEVVERQAARVAYEAFLHRRVDPALLEKQAGNELRARVFPIPAGGSKEIILSYSQELARTREPYHLALRGLPRLERLDVEVTTNQLPPSPAGTTLGGSQTTRTVVTVKKEDLQPDFDLDVPVPATATAGARGLRHANLTVTRVTPLLEAAPDRVGALVALVDTSASRALGFATQVQRVAALIEALSREAGADVPLRVAAFDQEVHSIFTGTLGTFGARERQALLGRRALGASDPGQALGWVASLGDRKWRRVLLVSDGVATAGATEVSALKAKLSALRDKGVERLDVLAVGGIRDEAALRALAAGGTLARDGALLDEALAPAELARALDNRTTSGLKVSVRGAAWVWPEQIDGALPGDEVLVYADIPERQPLQLTLQGPGGPAHSQVVPTTEVTRPLLERACVAARIRRLIHQRDTLGDADVGAGLRARIVELSTKHRVLSDFTALLVLETEADYARFNIDRRALADILVVGAAGVDVLRRQSAVLGPAPTDGTTGLGTALSGDVGLPRGERAAGAPTPSKRAAEARPPAMEAPAQAPDVSGDRDHDRIPDELDRCPDEPETYNGVDDDDGCPDKGRVILGMGRLQILDKVYFASGEQRLGATPVPLLDAIAATLKGNPQITRIEVQGHTDDRERARGDLGAARATAVVKALVARGVDEKVLVSRGYGKTRPLCSERNEECRGKNRRVEFIILERDGEPQVASQPPPARRDDARPPSEIAYWKVAALLESKQPRKAVEAAFAWLDKQPGDVLGLLAAGEALETVGDQRNAARAYGSLIDLFPQQADYRRSAGVRLERLGPAGLALAIDSLQQARALRPDHPAGHRLLAYALLRAGHHAEALDVILEGLTTGHPADRFRGVQRVLQEDAALIGAALVRAQPGRAGDVSARLLAVGSDVASGPSLRFVVGWETDASDIDLHVHDGRGDEAWFRHTRLASGGELYADVTTGFGPECFAIDGAARAYPYRLRVRYYNIGPTGLGIGALQVIEHDGAGRVRVDDRPFVLTSSAHMVDLGRVVGPAMAVHTKP